MGREILRNGQSSSIIGIPEHNAVVSLTVTPRPGEKEKVPESSVIRVLISEEVSSEIFA
jgi:hypothetical protein